MTDHFNWLMEISDPVNVTKIHDKRHAGVKKDQTSDLAEDAINLLVIPA